MTRVICVGFMAYHAGITLSRTCLLGDLHCAGVAFLETCFLGKGLVWRSCFVVDVCPFFLPTLDDLSSPTGSICYLPSWVLRGQLAQGLTQRIA